MTTTRCMICQNEALLVYVNAGLTKGVSNAGIAAAFGAAGGHLDPEVVGRHRKAHWTPPVDPAAPKATKRDLAILLRDKVADAVDALPDPKPPVYDDDGKLVTPGNIAILDKDFAPALSMGLKAQGLLDKREATDKKLGLAAGYLGLQLLLQGLGEAPAKAVMIEDGVTVEGEFEDVSEAN